MNVDFKSTTEKREEQRAADAGWNGKAPTAAERVIKDIKESIGHLPDDQK